MIPFEWKAFRLAIWMVAVFSFCLVSGQEADSGTKKESAEEKKESSRTDEDKDGEKPESDKDKKSGEEEDDQDPGPVKKVSTSTISSGELVGWEEIPAGTRAMLESCLDLAGRGLGYDFGSADPERGGLDCSGAVYHVLQEAGYKDVPRASDGQYRWVWEAKNFHAVNGRTMDSWEWEHIKPGDLIFWSGTYDVAERDPPVSHVMIFLGRDKSGEPLMFGATEGRPFRGERRYGVSVYSLRMPSAKSTARLLGYGAPPAESRKVESESGSKGKSKPKS